MVFVQVVVLELGLVKAWEWDLLLGEVLVREVGLGFELVVVLELGLVKA